MKTSTHHKDNRTFASAPREARAKRLLREAVKASSVFNVAKSLNRSTSGVRNWCNGDRPNLGTVQEIERIYGNTPALDAVRKIVTPRIAKQILTAKPKNRKVRRATVVEQPARIQTGISLRDALSNFGSRLTAIERRLAAIECGEGIRLSN